MIELWSCRRFIVPGPVLTMVDVGITEVVVDGNIFVIGKGIDEIFVDGGCRSVGRVLENILVLEIFAEVDNIIGHVERVVPGEEVG